MRERNDSRYDQFEISPETIEQELRPVDCEQRHTYKNMYNKDKEVKTVIDGVRGHPELSSFSRE